MEMVAGAMMLGSVLVVAWLRLAMQVFVGEKEAAARDEMAIEAVEAVAVWWVVKRR